MNPDQYRREGAEAMRASCVHAVNATASPIVGTPYSAGGRAFSDAIRAIDVDEVLARLPPAPDAAAEEWREIEQAHQPRLTDGYTAVRISKPGFWLVKGPALAAMEASHDRTALNDIQANIKE